MKNIRVRAALSALVALAPVSGAFAQSGDAVGSSAATTITPRVKTALVAQKALEGSNINVDTVVESRTVVLSGTVRSGAQKTLAGSIARYKATGFQVQNRLVIRAEQPTFHPTIPTKFKRTGDFLQLLAKSQGRNDGTTFRQRITPFPDVTRLLWFVSTRGVTIVDVNENDGKPLFVTRAHLSRDLKRPGSTGFDAFAYVGYIFAMPYAQYSSLTFTPTRNGVIVDMLNGHRMTWEREKGLLQLRKLEYLNLEGD